MNEPKVSVDFEGVIQRCWHAEGGQGDAPPLVVGQSEYDLLIEQGCPPNLLFLNKPIPVPQPQQQATDWYRKFERRQ